MPGNVAETFPSPIPMRNGPVLYASITYLQEAHTRKFKLAEGYTSTDFVVNNYAVFAESVKRLSVLYVGVNSAELHILNERQSSQLLA